ncbi:MAG: TraB family protein [Candidatus Altiarchaeales archaeon]|nr:TraB family protein [Candidatus Altiarchaeales archaeon]MBD3416708.1 TraB family protein [Candidatus Altiarchaeales archaeon]
MPVEELVLGDKTVYIVGTAHVSDESVKSVEESIRKYRPDAVAVELCEQRYQALKEERKWDETEITEVLSSGRVYLFLMQLLLSNFQRKIGEEVGVKPGAEMMKAVEVAEEEDIKVVLADRDVRVTLKRAMDLMSAKEKIRLLYGIVGGFIEGEEINEELIEKMKEKDVLTELMEELAVETPSIKRVLVDERDQHIAHRIYSAEGRRIVAVIGAGHMEGVKRWLNRFNETGGVVTYTHSMEGVEIGGVSRKKINLIAYGVPAAFIILIIWGYIQHGSAMTLDMIFRWFLINGTLSALGAALALAHPLTVVSAFLAAPFTSLNPAMAAGWVAGYVELKMRKPRVVDFKQLVKLDTREYWKNRVTRVVLIVVFANIGSTIGTFIALPYLASLL